MAGIKSINTKPEIIVRKILHKKGYRFRLHQKDLPGKPDIVLKKYKAVIFVNGCFWHKHDCFMYKLPKSRKVFWKKKLDTNQENDLKNIKSLGKLKWRVITVWECSLKGKRKISEIKISNKLDKFLQSKNKKLIIRCKP